MSQPSQDQSSSIDYANASISTSKTTHIPSQSVRKIRQSYLFSIGFSVLAIAILFLSLVTVKQIDATGVSKVYINGLGLKSGDSNLLNLVSSDTGIGIYLLGINILLIILLVMGAVTLKYGFVSAAYVLILVLFFANGINISYLSSVTLSTTTTQLSVNVSAAFFSVSYGLYFFIILHLFGISLILRKAQEVQG